MTPETWRYSSVFPKEQGWRFEDYTTGECERLAYVFDAAMSEAGYPATPEPDPTHPGNFYLTCKGVPTAIVERARVLALMAIGRGSEMANG